MWKCRIHDFLSFSTAEQCLFCVGRFEQLRFHELGSLSSVLAEGIRVDYICFYLSSLLSDLSFRHRSPVGVSRCWQVLLMVLAVSMCLQWFLVEISHHFRWIAPVGRFEASRLWIFPVVVLTTVGSVVNLVVCRVWLLAGILAILIGWLFQLVFLHQFLVRPNQSLLLFV